MDTMTRRIAMFTRITRDQTEITPLPGRDWHAYIGPHERPDRTRLVGRLGLRARRPPGRPRPRQPGGDRLLPVRSRPAGQPGPAPPSSSPASRSSIPAGHVPCDRVRPPEPLELLCSSRRRSCRAPTRRAGRPDVIDARPLPRTPARRRTPEEVARRIRVESSGRSTRPARATSAARCPRPTSWRRSTSTSCGSGPSEPDWPERDRFVLSKGHASVGLYATLALRGTSRSPSCRRSTARGRASRATPT